MNPMRLLRYEALDLGLDQSFDYGRVKGVKLPAFLAEPRFARLSEHHRAFAVAPCFSANRHTPKEQEILRGRIASRTLSQFFGFAGGPSPSTTLGVHG